MELIAQQIFNPIEGNGLLVPGNDQRLAIHGCGEQRSANTDDIYGACAGSLELPRLQNKPADEEIR